MSMAWSSYRNRPPPCRSEPARDEPESAAEHQIPASSLTPHRKQARSYKGLAFSCGYNGKCRLNKARNAAGFTGLAK